VVQVSAHPSSFEFDESNRDFALDKRSGVIAEGCIEARRRQKTGVDFGSFS
jgi:hypothetical protein